MHKTMIPDELQFAINLMAGCATITRNVQQKHIIQQNKADRSPVTIADYAVQAYVAQAILQSYPDDVMVGEETGNLLLQDESLLDEVTDQVKAILPDSKHDQVIAWIDHGQSQPVGRYWVLDPVDGTKGFLRRMQYATALALIEDGEVILGVLGCPNLPYADQVGVMAYAYHDQGAWWLPYNQQTQTTPMRVSEIKDLSQFRILRSFEDSHTDSSRIDSFARHAGVTVDPVRMDSQAKYFLLAGGQAELSMRLLAPERTDYREYIWDQAPGYRVVLEAGGTITDTDGKSLDFSTGRRLTNNRGIFSTNGWIHEEVLKVLQQL
ncbi:MAG: 3'(2'),5'-bisphosphate nucleotidase [Chloroflexi bacterium HGW-Chloroflexi-3]|nr:MAG: 3'(2'),5'-bisphosphate nucleotidase [Chloroflexi bacterium HGW-Chloroflexi-3]